MSLCACVRAYVYVCAWVRACVCVCACGQTGNERLLLKKLAFSKHILSNEFKVIFTASILKGSHHLRKKKKKKKHNSKGKGGRVKNIFILFYFTTVLSKWDFSHGKFALLSQGKANCDNLRCMLGVVVFPQSTEFWHGLFNVHTDVNAWGCTQRVYGHRKRVCTESWIWEKNPLHRRGIEPATAA